MNVQSYCIYSPAFGRVLSVNKIGNYTRIAIFLPLYANHHQFAPADGTVTMVRHNKGRFRFANAVRKSLTNARTEITFKTFFGNMKVFQIAGAIARTIVTDVKKDDKVKQKQIIGKIKFGSRVDLYIPCDMEVFVKKGGRVKGGKTVVAKILQVFKKTGT